MFAPGSALWLLRHELRYLWRTRSKRISAGLGSILLFGFMQIFAIFLATASRSASLPAAFTSPILAGTTFFVLILMISTGLSQVTMALFDRRDLDLILSAPVAARTVIIVRSTAVMIALAIEIGLIAFPFANAFGIWRDPKWFAAYLVVPAWSMVATALDLALALGLVRWIGVRRTRTAAQIVAALIALALVITVQLRRLAVPRLAQPVRLQGGDGWMSLPERALQGELLPLAALVFLGIGLFAAANLILADRFVTALGQARDAEPPRRARRDRGGGPRFRTGAALRRKETRLLGRNPWLITVVVQKLIPVVPFLVPMLRNPDSRMIWLVIPFVAGGLASALLMTVLSGGELPDLVRAAPVPWDRIRRAKIEAALMPVAVVILPAIALAFARDPQAGVAVALSSAGVVASSALLHSAAREPVAATGFNARPMPRPGYAVGEILLMLAWIGIAFLVLTI